MLMILCELTKLSEKEIGQGILAPPHSVFMLLFLSYQ